MSPWPFVSVDIASFSLGLGNISLLLLEYCNKVPLQLLYHMILE